ncbi:unnamed protein product [Musa acuminata subsp. malaccensis]|uniref:(wild Malaysian banana) hypothetical protein n=1 Tax=Musa acuminata subsp. malaccensis TaxID=214687 RepID=A0A804JUX1_MUSAM|nr:PREDICTED: uncharacterized protein LOC103991836 [Musa acuminata subsp. malaccensis]CAG1856342.1 unnamed protein product [Musa acuminata subsp. malaccensis]
MAAMGNSSKTKRRRVSHSKDSKYSLPDELLVQILSLLPVKSALRFRCVSRKWLALLSDRGPYSVRYLCPTMCGFFYRRQHLGQPWRYAPIHPYRDHHFDLNMLTAHLPDHRNLTLLDSCNGLLLLGCREERSYKSMIICNPFRNEETDWVTLHMNASFKLLPLREFVSSKLVSHRASPHFKCFFFFEDFNLNELGVRSVFWYTKLSSDIGQSHYIDNLPQHSPPQFDIYDVAFVDHCPQLCIISEDETDHVICVALNKSWEGRVRSLMGVSRGLAHFAFCDEHELHIWVLVKEDGKRVWKPKHICSSHPLIKQHKESHRRRKNEGNERVYSIFPLGFHPDLDVIFLQIEWRIYSLHLGSGSLDEVAGERGANPEGQMFLFHPFTMDPSASLGERREYHMELPDMNT